MGIEGNENRLTFIKIASNEEDLKFSNVRSHLSDTSFLLKSPFSYLTTSSQNAATNEEVMLSSETSSNTLGLVLGIFFGLLVPLVCISAIIFLYIRQKRPISNVDMEEIQNSENLKFGNLMLKEEIEFGNMLGKGNFGEVYKGKMGFTQVAVSEFFFFKKENF